MSRERDAVHEAGHAVGSARLGLRVEAVVLRGHELAGEMEPDHVGIVWAERIDADDPRGALVALSGLEAERRLACEDRPWSLEAEATTWWFRLVVARVQPHDQIRAHVLGLLPSDARWWDAIQSATVDLVGLWWPDVVRVARRLNERGRLSGSELQDLLPPMDARMEATQRLILRRMRCAAICA